jgi:hypothetical protein
MAWDFSGKFRARTQNKSAVDSVTDRNSLVKAYNPNVNARLKLE